MLSAAARHQPKGYKFSNGMLNVAYLTGFVRKPTESGFLLQQNNNLAQSIPIRLPPKAIKPREFAPVTVYCHVVGTVREDGRRECVLNAFDIKAPSTRSMPTWVAWNSSANLPDKANPDSFVPFSANGEMKGAIAEQVLPNEQESEEQESIVRAIIEATHGQLDTRLGYSSNVVMVAGFVDSMAIVNGNEYRKDHLGVLLRQHEDPAKSIPLQLYSRNLASHTSSITIGMPAKVIGELRQKVVPNENGEGIKEMYMYLRCAELVHAQRGQDIKEEPVWLRSILERILSEKMEAETRRRLRREAAAVPQAAEIVMPD